MALYVLCRARDNCFITAFTADEHTDAVEYVTAPSAIVRWRQIGSNTFAAWTDRPFPEAAFTLFQYEPRKAAPVDV